MTCSNGILRGCALALLLAGSSAGFAAGTVELVSRADPRRLSDTAAGAAPNTIYPSPAISADGRWVVFLSAANNLVAGQNSGGRTAEASTDDVFLHDRISGATTLVSHSTASPSTPSGGGAESAVLSADGRWVAFVSLSTDLVAGQPAGAFLSRHLFLFDRDSGTTALVSPSAYLDSNTGNGVREVAISGDGRFVAFTSDAPDLVPGQNGGTSFNVFLYDRTAATASLVSHVAASATTAGNDSSEDLSISADGRWIAFGSNATNLDPSGSAGVFLYDRTSGAVRRIGSGMTPTISADGGTAVFFSAEVNVSPGQVDTNGATDVFLYDRGAGTITLVSHAVGQPTTAANGESPAGFGVRPSLSADGRWVAFLSNATNLVSGQIARPGPAVFLFDRTSGAVILASRSGSSPATPGSDAAVNPSISADGRFVAFESAAADLVPGQVDTSGSADVFLFDRSSGSTSLVSSANGSPSVVADNFSYGPTISADGSRIAFYSAAGNLQPGVADLNGGEDAVLYDTAARTDAYATLHASGQPSLTPDADSVLRALSGDGRYVLFESGGVNLVAGQADTNQQGDVFLYDKTTQASLLVSRSAASPTATGDDLSEQSGLSADGRYVVFASLASNLVAGVNDQPVDPETGVPTQNEDVFLFDRTTGSTVLVSRSATVPATAANGESLAPAISADGRWVAFVSVATDLVPGIADTNRTGDVFLWDRVTGATILVSRSSTGARKTANGYSTQPLLSADGRYVVYESTATDLVPGQTEGANGGTIDVFLFDRVAGTTALVTHTRTATEAGGGFEDPFPSLSADGRYVAFSSRRPDLTSAPGGDLDVYLYDRIGGGLTLAATSLSNSARQLTLSADGRWIAFLATGEVLPGVPDPGDADQLYLYDRVSKGLTLVTRSLVSPGQASQGVAQNPTLSADGRFVAFDSDAPDLVAGQLGAGRGVFLYDRIAGTRTVVSRSPASAVTSAGGEAPLISADGQAVAFDSVSSGLAAGDFNGRSDVFLYRAGSGSGGPVILPPCALFSGALRSNARKVLAVAGACGVPAGAKQVLVKLTVSQGTGKGNVQLYPGNVTSPSAGILRFNRGAARSAAFTVSLGNGGIALLPFVNGNGTVRVAVEVDGYTP